ncbi:MAG TPA: serine/threonine-protein kinase, partial [Gemmataceae bacterium]|nr:serine/threonine-protein kinase [Gemmataceae bacterium]
MSGCPSSETLEQLLAGELAEPAAHALRTHLRGCGQCQKLLDRLSDDAELRTWMAKAPHRPARSVLDPALVRVLAGLRTTLPNRSGSDTPAPAGRDLSLFLGPAQQEGDLGTLGPYTVQGELGRGGMGIVLRAWDPVLQRTVAVKMLRPELANEQTRARFVREAQAAARVTHDHVVRVYAVAHPPDGLPYFAMEYLAGSTLAEQIRTQQSLEPRVAAALVAQVAQGLAAAHAAGLIHRDIKPSNILLEPGTGRAKITDFGLARLDSQPSGTTQEGILAGTPTYMSPEQAQGLRSLDGRSDVYSLGATLYEALTGQTPFRGAPHMVLQQVIDEEPRPLRQLNDRIPRDLETICLKCLQKEPAQRYAGALVLAQDLQRFLDGEPVQARPVGSMSRLARWCRRRPLVAGLAAGLVTVFCAGIAGVAWEWRQAVQSSTEALQNAAEAQEQRVRAEQHLQSLREAVDKYYTRVSENQLLREPS